MSTEIDQRVVEMRFDNKHFESNVQTSMSTLDKLKSKLNLTGATKGMENVSAAAKNVNLSPLGTAVESVQTKFSALQVIGVTALANITNSAVNAGKRIVSALTIDPVKTGFSEYETKINSIQTIWSNTRSKGTTMEDITRVIDELNTYADKTIYNFQEMTRNIGTFTAAGVGLEESAAAIQGIANLAAASGSNSQQASTAMYQLSQALATGTVKLMDWNSVVNAGMGGEKFQEALKQTAREMGVSVDAIIEKNGSFRDSLHEEWLTADILNTTLQKFTKEGAAEYADAMVKSGKYTKEQAEALKLEADEMERAATEVKTFTQLWDTLKESAQSGWGRTWEIIVGDFNEARELFSGISKVFGGFIDRMSDWRNGILEGALDLSKPWVSITEKLEGAGLGKIQKVAETVGDLTDKLEYYQDIVNKVWRGDYKNADTGRYGLLDDAGYDHRVVQDLVNKGYQYKLTVEDIEESHKKFGLTMEKSTKETKEASKSFGKLTDEQLRNAKLTEDEIDLYRALEREADKAGMSVADFAKKMSEQDGRSLLIDSFKNVGSMFAGIGKAIKDAWVDIFDPPGVGELAVKLYGIISAINEFTKKLTLTDEKTGELNDTGKKIQSTFKGVFAVIDIITTILGGGFKIAFKAITQLLGYFDLSVLDVTAAVGDALVKFRDWIDSTLDFTKVFDIIVPFIKDAVEAVKEWVGEIEIAGKSPKDILTNLVEGIKDGSTSIKDGLKDIWDNIKTFFSNCVEKFKKIDFSKLIAVGVFLTTLITVKKIFDSLSAFASPLEGLGDMFEGLGKTFKGMALNFKSSAILKIAIAIGILALSISVLAKIKSGDLWEAVGVLAVLSGLMVGLAFIVGKMDTFSFSAKDSFTLLAIAGSLLLLVFALKQIAGVTGDDALETVKLLGAIIVGLGVVVVAMVALNKSAGAMNKVGSMLLKISMALLIMVGVIKLASMLEQNEIEKGLGVVTALELLMLGLIAVSKLAGQHASKAGSMLLKISFALLIMVGVIKLASMMDHSDVNKGIKVIAAVELLAIGLIAVSKLAGQHAAKAGSMILKMSIAMLIMVQVIKQIAELDDAEVERGLGVIATVEILFGALIAASKLAGQNAGKAGTMLLAMSVAMLILSGVIFILSKIEPDGLKRALGAVTVLGLIFIALVAVSKNAEGAKGSLIVLTIAISILVGALIALSFIDAKDLVGPTLAISMLMGAFALLAKASGQSGMSLKTLIGMSLMIALLGAIVYALSKLPMDDTLGKVASLSVLLIAMSTSMVIMSKAGRVSGKSLLALAGLAGVMVLIGLVLTLMSKLPIDNSFEHILSLSAMLLVMSGVLAILSAIGPAAQGALWGVLALTALTVPLALMGLLLAMMSALKVQDAMTNVAALSVLLVVMSGTLFLLAAIGPLATNALLGVVALAALAIPLAMMGLVLAMMSALKVQDAMESAISLSILLVTMSATLILLSVVGTLALPAIAGIGVLVLFVAAIGGLIAGIGYLVTEFPQLETFINTGLPLLEKLGYGIGSFFGSFAKGFSEAVMSILPTLGNRLTEFMDNGQTFFDGMGSMKTSTFDNMKALAEALIVFTAADLISGIAAFVPGSLSNLGLQLSDFMENASGFIEGSSSISGDMMTGVKSLAEAILVLTAANVLDGLTRLFTGGDSSLESFSKQLPGLGTNLSQFAANLGTFTEAQVTTVKCAGDAIKAMAEAAESIPNEGGWLAKIVGDNSIETFGGYLPGLGTNLSQFAANLGTFTDAQVATVTCAADAIKTMASAAEEIPNEGGWLAAIVGDNSIETFGGYLPGLGTNLSGFAANLGTFTDAQVTTISCAASAIKAMAEAANSIPNEGGWLAAIVGDNSIETFGGYLPGLGTHLSEFACNLGEFGEDKIATVTCAVDAISAIAALSDVDLKTAKDQIGGFGDKLVGFGTDISDFAVKMSGVSTDSITAAVDNVKELTSMISTISETDASVALEFSESLKNLAGTGVDGFINGIRESHADVSDAGEQLTNTLIKTMELQHPNYKTAGSDMMDQVMKGISGSSTSFTTTITTVIASVITTIRGYYTSFYSAGSYLVDGFSAGISASTWKAEAKAEAMAKAAEEAAEEELGIQSPSRVFYGIGAYVGQGFVNALSDYGSKAYNASASMADSARNGFSNAIGRITDVINSDIDTQPTIRPVLDLSEVEAGANSIGGMLNIGPSVGVLANVSGVNSMMNGYSQNGRNDEVVSAINKLRKDMSNVGGVTHNHINGVTYDDGSNITSAVETLVRAAKIERRI